MISSEESTKNEGIPECYSPFFEITIFANGKVGPCCFLDRENIEEIDDVSEKTVEEVWRGENFQLFRERILTGVLPRACKECSISSREMKDLKKKYEKEYNHLGDEKSLIRIQKHLLSDLSDKYRNLKKSSIKTEKNLKDELEKVKLELDKLKKERKNVGEKKKKLEKKLDDVTSERDQLKKEVDKFIKQRNELEKEKLQVESERDKLSEEKEKLENLISDMEENEPLGEILIRLVNENTGKVSNKIEEVIEENKSLKKELSEIKSSISYELGKKLSEQSAGGKIKKLLRKKDQSED